MKPHPLIAVACRVVYEELSSLDKLRRPPKQNYRVIIENIQPSSGECSTVCTVARLQGQTVT